MLVSQIRFARTEAERFIAGKVTVVGIEMKSEEKI